MFILLNNFVTSCYNQFCNKILSKKYVNYSFPNLFMGLLRDYLQRESYSQKKKKKKKNSKGKLLCTLGVL